MYYPIGWPRILRIPQKSVEEIRFVVCNRDKLLTAIITKDSLIIWFVRPCVPLAIHRRSPISLNDIGENTHVVWRHDSSMIAVGTSLGHLIIYNLVLPVDISTCYSQIDPAKESLKRDSNELFTIDKIPPIIFALVVEIKVEKGISSLMVFRDELMVSTFGGWILRYSWEGIEIRDYALDLLRVPFCTDQLVLKAIPLGTILANEAVQPASTLCVVQAEYSPLLGGFAVVLRDGKAGLMTASTLNFDPNSVSCIWSPKLDDAACLAINHRFKLIVFGRKNSHTNVYSIDEQTGGLVLSHTLVLPAREYPGCPGTVSCLRWSPEGSVIAVAWTKGGFSLWSTFGTLIVCSLSWDYGPNITDPAKQNPICIVSMDWSVEGYGLWIVNSTDRSDEAEDPDFMPYPSKYGDSDNVLPLDESSNLNLGNCVIILRLVKSPLAINPCMSKHQQMYLHSEDQIFMNISLQESFNNDNEEIGGGSKLCPLTGNHWTSVSVPHAYIGNSWPIRYTALDDSCKFLAVAGRVGFAHVAWTSKRWRLFINETQEREFVVTGDILWWNCADHDFIVAGVYNLVSLGDEIRIYPRIERLDKVHASIVQIDGQVLRLNTLDNKLILFGTDNKIIIYGAKVGSTDSAEAGSRVKLTSIWTLDLGLIVGPTFHPVFVTLIALTNLRLVSHRQREASIRNDSDFYGNSPPLTPGLSGSRGSSRESSPPVENLSNNLEEFPYIIVNLCGRVIMLQVNVQQHSSTASTKGVSPLALPTVLALCCESIWFSRDSNPRKPHLTQSLWLYCGSHGMKVWVPIVPRDDDAAMHSFMSNRIMLHYSLEKFYPLVILFEDAVIVGIQISNLSFSRTSNKITSLPYCFLERTSCLFLHSILRQLIRRNLGFHAWEIARTCANLPYFQHSLELLLHEVLEEEATSTEPIPDALLPSVVEFIREFPIYFKTIGCCARKTEVALWPHLFAVVGDPRALFVQCIASGHLDTAATMLLILQNLETSIVAQNHASLLLNAALESKSWLLVKDLIRYLGSIDPEDNLEDLGHQKVNLVNGAHFYGGPTPQMTPSGSAITAGVDDISMLLGTLQVPRGTNRQSGSSPKMSTETIMYSSVANNFHKVPSGGSSTVGSVRFIDTVLQRHARKLLTECCLRDLGIFSARLDFDLFEWLSTVDSTSIDRYSFTDVENFVASLKKIHNDFCWPYPNTKSMPDYVARVADDDVLKLDCCAENRKISSSDDLSLDPDVSSMDYSVINNSAIPVSNSTCIREDGNDIFLNNSVVLRSLSFRDDASIHSETSGQQSINNAIQHGRQDWLKTKPIGESNANRSLNKTLLQIRYLLDIFLKANCFELAALLCVVLFDYNNLIVVVEAVTVHSSAAVSIKSRVSRLYQRLKSLEAWALSECPGYSQFFNLIQPQLNILRSFLLQPQVNETQGSSSAISGPIWRRKKSSSPSHQVISATVLNSSSNSKSGQLLTEIETDVTIADDDLTTREKGTFCHQEKFRNDNSAVVASCSNEEEGSTASASCLVS